MLSVCDTGTGMTDEVKAHLFEAFFTTKPKGKGTGLGLATCQTIVQQCGGHIAVESELGKGTTFRVYFPRVEQAITSTDTTFKKRPMPRGTETLLLVEDEPAVRHLACDVLRGQGYNVALGRNNGQEGLHVARQHKGHADQSGRHRCHHAADGRQGDGGVAEIQLSRSQNSCSLRATWTMPLPITVCWIRGWPFCQSPTPPPLSRAPCGICWMSAKPRPHDYVKQRSFRQWISDVVRDSRHRSCWWRFPRPMAADTNQVAKPGADDLESLCRWSNW